MSRPGTPSSTPPRRPAKRDVNALRPLSVAGPSPALSITTQPQKPRDPVIDEALQLKAFEAEYSTEALVGSLSEKLIAESKRQAGPFDPKPFLQTFSPALDSLLSLRQQVAERTKKMESEVRRAEREYGKRLRELDGGFETIGSSFSNLETKITDVGRTAVRIGEQLESLHQTRSTAQSVSLLLSYYLSLCHHTSTTPDPNNPSTASTPLEQLFEQRTSREGRSRLAIILRRLMAVARDVAESSAAALADAEAASSSKVQVANGGESDVKEESTRAQKQINQKRHDKEKAERVRDEIERYCERFEKEVLRLFDRSYRKGDPKMMAHCAKTLQDFNGGASCVQIYVNQHDFFISRDRVLDEDGPTDEGLSAPKADFWSALGNPDASPPTSEPGLKALFKDIRVTVSQEAQIVNAVFPNPNAVMENFLQRVFAQVIQQQVESLVSRAQGISTLATLRILHLVHQQCSTLCEDLKSYDAQMRSLPSSSKGPAPAGEPLAAILDRALEELFVPYLEGSRYMDSETKNLVELYAGLLSRFTRYHETVLKAKPNSLLDKVVGQLSSSTTAASSSSTAQAARSAIAKYANVFTSAGNNVSKVAMPPQMSPSTSKPQVPPGLNVPTANTGRASPMPGQTSTTTQRSDQITADVPSPADGVLSVEMAGRMLRWHAEAVGRAVELSATADVAKNIQALYRVLTGAIGRSMVETSINSAVARCDQHDVRVQPDLTVLAVLKPANMINHLWQRYTSTALFPLSSASAPIRKELATTYSYDLTRMENKVNHLIQRSLDLIVNWLASLLTRQKKNDFKPKDEELSFARNNTEPCSVCCEFLDSVREVAMEGLSGKNREAFLTEVGVAFHSLLLDHFKKFPVNPTGGLMLTKDLALYQETIFKYGITAVNERFDMLRQLGNSFIVQPNVLKSYMSESHLGRIDPRLLRPYLAQRSDYSQFARSLNLDDGLPSEDLPSSKPTAIGHLPHVTTTSGTSNRFSMISGVAGAGMGKLRDMLKDIESMSPEEQKAADERARRYATAARKTSMANATAARAATNRAPAQQITHFPMFMH